MAHIWWLRWDQIATVSQQDLANREYISHTRSGKGYAKPSEATMEHEGRDREKEKEYGDREEDVHEEDAPPFRQVEKEDLGVPPPLEGEATLVCQNWSEYFKMRVKSS